MMIVVVVVSAGAGPWQLLDVAVVATNSQAAGVAVAAGSSGDRYCRC